ncbi:MAG: CBS domain-containing protein, partial [Pyrinomonadaceae bacterium]
MSTNVSTVTSNTSISNAAKILRGADIGILPVIDDASRLVGLVTDRDIVVRAVAEGKDVSSTTV